MSPERAALSAAVPSGAGEDARRAAVQAEDPAGSFRSGCAGILVRDGSHVILERMRIRPAGCQ